MPDPDSAGLEIVGLRKAFGDIQALADCSLVVRPGELVGFLGPNGAGKTTTMRAILGLLATDAGTITWNGAPVDVTLRRRIGYMPQERGLYVRMRVHEHVAYIGRLAGLDPDVADRQASEWVDRVGLTDRRDDLIQELSVGNQQRVQLAVALVHDPDLLVLDEPFAGLDPVAVATLSEVMRDRVEGGAAVVFSSHQLDLVQDLCETVSIVANGRTLAGGAVDELRAASDRRVLKVAWSDPPPDWQPSGCRSSVLLSSTRVRYDVSRDVDGPALIAAAARHGSLTAVTFEPPGLDEVFVELVTDGEVR